VITRHHSKPFTDTGKAWVWAAARIAEGAEVWMNEQAVGIMLCTDKDGTAPCRTFGTELGPSFNGSKRVEQPEDLKR
jgi:hypothetical protein